MDKTMSVEFCGISSEYDQNLEVTMLEQDQAYLRQLHDQLHEWEENQHEQIRNIVQEKIDDIKQLYDLYCQETDKKCEVVKERVEKSSSSTDNNTTVETFRIYVPSNTLKNRIHLHTTSLTKSQLTERLQLDYVHDNDVPRQEIDMEVEIKVKKRIENRRNSNASSNSSLIRIPAERKLNRSNSARVSSNEHRILTPLPAEHGPRKSSTRSDTSAITEDDQIPASGKIDNNETPTHAEVTHEQSQTPPTVTKNQLSTSKALTEDETLKPVSVKRDETPIPVSVSRDETPTPISLKRDETPTPISLKGDETPKAAPETQYQPQISQQASNDRTPASLIAMHKTSTPSTKLYIGRENILTPVFINKSRDVSNETERITEYSIDSIAKSTAGELEISNINSDNGASQDIKLFRAYKTLIKNNSDYQVLSTTSDDDDDDLYRQQFNDNRTVNLRQFDLTNYSTIMFSKFETKYDALSASTKRNELIIYNLRLHILMILKYEDKKKCEQESYIQWPNEFREDVTDITYCEQNDQFLISTLDDSRLYFFNRDLLALTDLGRLSKTSKLHRIHSYGKSVYCIVGNTALRELQLNEQCSGLRSLGNIKISNPDDASQPQVLHLLDVSCDEKHIVVIYASENDEIRLRSIDRRTKRFHRDFPLDGNSQINKYDIRIEATKRQGNFVYLNSSKRLLKSIDLINYDEPKITSIMHRHAVPGNVCFLNDERLVIFYKNPYFLSVHGINNCGQN